MGARNEFWYWITFSFAAFYFAETTLKLWALGFDRFWHEHAFQHRCDLFTVYFLFAMELVFIFVESPPDIFVRISVLLHISRIIRVVYRVKPLQELATLMLTLAPTYRLLAMLLVIVFYIYATIGEQAFGGLIRTRGPLYEKIKDSGFGTSGYYALNFNDFFSGVVLLFVLMVVNNWFVVAEAFNLVTGLEFWPQTFFVSFYVIVNLIVLNILVALILDCFGTVRGAEELKVQEVQDCPEREISVASQPMRTNSHSHRLDREDVLRRVFQGDLVEAGEEMDRALRQLRRRQAAQWYTSAEDDALVEDSSLGTASNTSPARRCCIEAVN